MEYFAGANTRNGFVSVFDECFKNIERLYILKGSSGCGKSTFMKKVAERAVKHGFSVDYIYCSADSQSLDGIIIQELNIAIADGTSPHIMDVKYPCVRETIINLGQFWNESKLLPKREEIIELTNSKSEYYKNAYKSLSAFGSVEDIKKQLLSRAVIRDKMDSIVFRIVERVSGSKGETKKLFATAFTSEGLKTAKVFDDVKTLYRVNGNLSDLFMASFVRAVNEIGTSCTISYSPTDATLPDAVYFEETKTLVTSLALPPCKSAVEEKTVSTSRFTNNAVLASVRAKLRALDKLSNELLFEAKTQLSNAKSVHNEIEKIYIPAMDFKSLDDYTFALINRIFSE